MNDIYASDPAGAASAIPYASVYSAPTTGAPTYSTESPLYMQQNITAPYQTIYPVKKWIYNKNEFISSYEQNDIHEQRVMGRGLNGAHWLFMEFFKLFLVVFTNLKKNF